MCVCGRFSVNGKCELKSVTITSQTFCYSYIVEYVQISCIYKFHLFESFQQEIVLCLILTTSFMVQTNNQNNCNESNSQKYFPFNVQLFKSRVFCFLLKSLDFCFVVPFGISLFYICYFVTAVP